MSEALVPAAAEPVVVADGEADVVVLPALIVDAGPDAVARFLEFFAGRIANARTRAAYGRAVGQFLAWCEARGLGLDTVSPLHVAAYIRTHPGSVPTVKQHLAAIRVLCDWLVVNQVLPVNPAAAVRGPKHVVTKGSTPVLSPAEARKLLEYIDLGTLAGFRDLTLLSVMLYTASRGSARSWGCGGRTTSSRGAGGWLRLHEKGGKRHDVPAHHRATEALDAYLEAAGLEDGRAALFQSVDRAGDRLTGRPLSRRVVLAMIKRRAAAASLPSSTCCHHVPGDGDHGVPFSNGWDHRAGAADRGARIAQDNEASTTGPSSCDIPRRAASPAWRGRRPAGLAAPKLRRYSSSGGPGSPRRLLLPHRIHPGGHDRTRLILPPGAPACPGDRPPETGKRTTETERIGRRSVEGVSRRCRRPARKREGDHIVKCPRPLTAACGHYSIGPMSQHAPGRSHRTGISLAELFRMLPDDTAAERWFVEKRWPDGICCHYCGSESVQTGAKHKTMPFRCRDCRKRFSVRTGTVMQSSKLGYQTWAAAIYLLTTSLKGVPSMKLHRDLNITQKSAWYLAHRLRETWQSRAGGPFGGVGEFEGQPNNRDRNTIDQMSAIVHGADEKRLRYADLTAHAHGRAGVTI